MEKWKESFLSFWNNKIYVLMLSLTAVFSYGFLITHQTVGIDDTPYTYYFEEGLNVIVGRWFMYVANKVFHIADFAPLVTDLAGVLILMVAVTVWATLIYAFCKDAIPKWGYAFFACIFLSCPLLSEVYTYYLHNGVSVGYLCVGVSLCFFKELTEGVSLCGKGNSHKAVSGRENSESTSSGAVAEKMSDSVKEVSLPWRGMFRSALGTAFFLFVAMGCYESFMIVWLVGVLMVLLLKRYMGQKCKVFPALVAGAVCAVVAIVLRSVMISACIAIFDLEAMREEAVQRSIGEMLGWMFETGAGAEFAMAIKRTFVMYFAFAYAYYPIKIFVWVAIFIVIFAVYRSIRQRDFWILLLTAGLFIAAFLLVVIEGSVTLYRAAQFLPVICGFGALLVSYAVAGVAKASALSGEESRRVVCKVTSGAVIFLLSTVLWNQCYDMNRWFYVDWLKYEDAVGVMEQIALELERDFDTSKPIVFTGTYQPPKSIIGDAFVPYNSETYYKIKRLTDLLDENLLDKFNRGEYGVWVAQTPALSVLDWGIAAFDSSEEMVKFFAMHGEKIVPNTDEKRFAGAIVESMDYPHFPEAGSIVDMGDYIIVHF